MGLRRTAFAIAALATALVAAPAGAQSPGPLTGVKLLQVTLPAADLARAVAYYRDVLGLKLLFQVKGAAFFDAGGVRLRLEEVKDPQAANVVIYFDDPGLSKAEPLAKRGVKFEGPPETVQRTASADVKLLEFSDPDGNPLALIGEVRRR